MSESILCLFHKHCYMPRKNLTIKCQLVRRNKVLAICIVTKLSMLWSTKWIQQVVFVNEHAEFSPTCCLYNLLVSWVNNLIEKRKTTWNVIRYTVRYSMRSYWRCRGLLWLVHIDSGSSSLGLRPGWATLQWRPNSMSSRRENKSGLLGSYLDLTHLLATCTTTGISWKPR